MTTQYEQAVAALAETAGVEIKIGDDRVATMVVEERVVQLRPSNEAESGLTAFTIVASADGGSFERFTLEAALMMNLFGAETGKGNLGLFGDSLFLSKDVSLDGVTPEELAERLLAFSRLADDIEKQFGGEGGGGDGAAANDARPAGIGDFMKV